MFFYKEFFIKALILEEYNKLVFTETEIPEINDDEVLINVKACGICGSDVHGIDGSTGRRIPPIIMGHEASGIIVKIGKNVNGWKENDRVTFDSTIYCGKCDYCKNGKVNLCDNRRVLGVSCNEYKQGGAFAEYVAVPQHILYKLPEGISFEEAAMIEAVSIALHAVKRTTINLDDTAVVIGSGMIGLLLIQCLQANGCKKIIAVDVDEKKLDMAKKMGAHIILNSTTANIKKEILKSNKNKLPDIAFDVVGLTASTKSAIDSLNKGGSLTIIGNFSPQIDLPLQSIVTKEISIFGSCASSGEYPECIEMICQKKIDVNTLMSKIAPLSEGAVWFNKLYNKEPGLMKVILIP